MDESVFALISRIEKSLGFSGIFLCGFSVVFLAFLVCLVLSIFRRGYGIKKRLWLIVVCVSTLVVEVAFTLHLNGGALFPMLLSAVIVALVGTVFLIPVRQGVYSKESLSLAEF